jgi:hypothetical protein
MTHLQTPAPQAAPPPPGTTINALPGQPDGATALRAQLVDLRTRLNELTSERSVLVEHARSADAGIRGRAENEILTIDLEAARVRARITSIESQLSQDGGGAGTLVPPPPPSSPPMIDPDAVTAVFVLTALAVLVPLSIGISRRLWRRAPVASASALEDKVSPRLDRLEQAVDAIAIEVERISEGQRFVTRVLSERAPAVQASAQVSNDGAAVGEAKPFLALGAGPMEPIRAAERQAVKQSVTPH